MNLILLFDDDFIDGDRVRLEGRRFAHVRDVHRKTPGEVVTVGKMGGRIGRGEIVRLDAESLEMRVTLDREPPAPLPLTLVLALPRPKVLNRVIAAVTSLGVKRLFLINAWRVEKSYWSTPRLTDENLHAQIVAGLEQARDTMPPSIEIRRLFRPFVEEELAAVSEGSLRLVAHPGGSKECPRGVATPVTLVVGPEGGLIDRELRSLAEAGFEAVTIGPRILRVETAVAALIGRILNDER